MSQWDTSKRNIATNVNDAFELFYMRIRVSSGREQKNGRGKSPPLLKRAPAVFSVRDIQNDRFISLPFPGIRGARRVPFVLINVRPIHVLFTMYLRFVGSQINVKQFRICCLPVVRSGGPSGRAGGGAI